MCLVQTSVTSARCQQDSVFCYRTSSSGGHGTAPGSSQRSNLAPQSMQWAIRSRETTSSRATGTRVGKCAGKCACVVQCFPHKVNTITMLLTLFGTYCAGIQLARHAQ
jgi:hypothetical protein